MAQILTKQAETVTELTNTDYTTITFERQRIEIPFSTRDQRDKMILQLIEKLQSKINVLEEQQKLAGQYIEQEISDSEAKQQVIEFLREQKLKHKNRIDLFEITNKLKIPADQVERIIDKLLEDELLKEL